MNKNLHIILNYSLFSANSYMKNLCNKLIATFCQGIGKKIKHINFM
ncbi:unknown [Acidaminococcus sp. CAG:917]|nr:unknown [Acidaminococcus sp. CAG:917]